jgi:hypothetical protein
MNVSANEQRNRGLNFVRRQIATGKATKADIERWAKELGPEVHQIAQDAAPPKSSAASKSAITKES